MKPIFAPSLMCMDICDTKRQMEVFNQYCGMLHVDIMDGHFAKNLALSPDFVKTIKRLAKQPIDAHMMVEHPGDFLDALAKAGADIISLHAETIGRDAYRILRRVKDLGCRCGVAICPATPLTVIEPYIEEIDMLTIMTVEVGYAGQAFIPKMLEKVAQAEQIRVQRSLSYLIQVDGAIGPKYYSALYEAGARAYVMGTSGLFTPDMELEACCQCMLREFTQATGVDV